MYKRQGLHSIIGMEKAEIKKSVQKVKPEAARAAQETFGILNFLNAGL